jgi:uncharacterized RDD family membrane protein YckC
MNRGELPRDAIDILRNPSQRTRGPRRATFKQRLIAALIDLVIMAPALLSVVPVWMSSPTEPGKCTDSLGRRIDCQVLTDGGVQAVFITFIIAVGIMATYSALMTVKRGATVGQRYVGIFVVDGETLDPVPLGKAYGRFFGRIPGTVLCGNGLFWMLWDDHRETWEDQMTNTRVLQR